MKAKKIVLWIIIALAAVGVVNAGLIYYKTEGGQPVPCFVVSGCDVVQNSIYSKLFGVPLSLWGIIYYAILAINTAILLRYVDLLFTNHAPLITVWFIYVAIGFLFSFYLLYLQAFVIKAFCSSCLFSFGEMIIIFIASVFARRKNSEKSARSL